MGRRQRNFQIGDLVAHRIMRDNGFNLGIVIDYDLHGNALKIVWSSGRVVYHIPEMIKPIKETN